MKVDIKIDIDIDDVFSKLHWKEQEEFIKNNINTLGGLEDVVNMCFDELDVSEFIESHIDELSDEALLEEIKSRGLKIE
jgi:hypothetical protein